MERDLEIGVGALVLEVDGGGAARDHLEAAAEQLGPVGLAEGVAVERHRDVLPQPDTRPGTVTWIASQAEFTPTPVQTREERKGLVRFVESGGLLFSDDCNHDVNGLYARSFEQEMLTIFGVLRISST